MLRSGNPVLRDDVFTGAQTFGSQEAMTIQGTVNKTMILLLLVFLTAGWAWSNPQTALVLMFPAMIIGFIVGLAAVFKKEWAGITAPIYAFVEGIILGGISLFFETAYPGVVTQAVSLTFATLFCLLMIYKSGLIKVTENFKLGIAAATGAVMVVYLVDMVMGFFGHRIPFIYQSGPIGIGFSLIVVGIAAFNLVLDFDFIENGAKAGAPRYMEWYGAFGLIVTLIWLYLEILRLLAKMRRR